MRIIGGEWRGRKIEEPRGRDVTPFEWVMPRHVPETLPRPTRPRS